MNELALQMSFSPARLTHTAQRMEEKGWLRRESSPEDRQGRTVRLTEEGEALTKAIWPEHARLIRTVLLDQVDDSMRQEFEDVFGKVRKAADQAGLDRQ